MQMMAANYSSSSRPHTQIRNSLVLLERRPLMQLKDYLLRDDLSSCSSNGFKSFPRKQCCSTIRFLLDKDLKTNPSPNPPHFLKRRRSPTLSSLHRAVINAVKLLPFPSSSSQKRSLLPRSFSRKLFKKSYWKRREKEESDDGIGRSRLFKDFLDMEQMQQSSISSCNNNNDNTCSSSSPPFSTDNNAQVITRSTSTSTTSWSNNVSKSGSWGTESEFTVGDRQNDVVEVKLDSVAEAVVGGDSDQITAKEWRNEEKEQFSPVSVLDCPFEDDQEDTASPFQCKLVRIEGTKQKLMKRIKKFESIAQIEPLDLERRIAQADSSDDDESVYSSTQSCSISDDNEENGTDVEVSELLELVKTTLPPDTAVTKIDRLLLDFFREKITENKPTTTSRLEQKEKRTVEYEQEFQVVREWTKGEPQEMFLGWEVKENRHVYVKDMEKNVKWRNFEEEKEEVALELELQIVGSLLHETLLDMF